MSGLRLLHTADWQIGRSYSRFDPDDAAVLAQARLDTVTRIAQHATTIQADAVLVAGDVFDAQTVSDRTLRRLFKALDAFSGPWIMIPGNHDAALAESVWTRAGALGAVPSNVHLVLRPGVVLFEDLRLAVLAAPLTQRHSRDDLTAWFDDAVSPAGYFRVGLAHGSVPERLAPDIQVHNPVSAQRAQTAGLDYLALGDWHGMLQISQRCWYSGTPEPDRFRDNAAGHVLEVALDHPGAMPQVTPVRLGRHQWASWDVRLQGASDVDVLLERLQALQDDQVVELTLSGQISLQDRFRLDPALGQADAAVRAWACDISRLLLEPTAHDLAALQADGYVADVLETLRAMQHTDAAQKPSDARSPAGVERGSAMVAREGEPDDDDARVARDALALLAMVLNEVRSCN